LWINIIAGLVADHTTNVFIAAVLLGYMVELTPCTMIHFVLYVGYRCSYTNTTLPKGNVATNKHHLSTVIQLQHGTV
jgi:hypothetical protein